MGYMTVNHICGHTERHQLYGPIAGRERQAARLAERKCSECYKAEREAEREAETAKAVEQAQAAGLPALQGSDKQVAWAESIRATMIETATAYVAKVAGATPANEQQAAQHAAGLAAAKATVEAMMTETSAKWWIDRRGSDPAKDAALAAIKALAARS